MGKYLLLFSIEISVSHTRAMVLGSTRPRFRLVGPSSFPQKGPLKSVKNEPNFTQKQVPKSIKIKMGDFGYKSH